ncbi:hypothetical protein [Listeria ilorinensis]|uniref:hypothetical protein n=1 Tax=Listeria ilorinensis TaxID=2867439 RepID=UPI001EF70E97|nr:hypothetical protein [Listeria ilorinensis]
MRLRIDGSLEQPCIVKDYHKKVLSLMKLGLAKTNEQKFEELFSNNQQKDYTFSVYLWCCNLMHNN